MQDQPRLHVDPAHATLHRGAALPMHESQAHHLGTVLRRAPGDGVRLFNARDGEWRATIASLRKGRGGFEVTDLLRPPAPEDGPLLLFAPVKRDATDLVVRMATELGARALWPVLTERTNSARVNTDRLRLIATEAAEQSERLGVPAIAEPRRLAAVLSEWPPGRGLWAAIERLPGPTPPGEATVPAGGATLAAGASTPPVDALLVGPEGGFTPLELDVLRARPFVTLISLGSRILRAETAAIAGLSCLQAAREQWGLACAQPALPSVRQRGSPTECPQPAPTEPDVEPR